VLNDLLHLVGLIVFCSNFRVKMIILLPFVLQELFAEAAALIRAASIGEREMEGGGMEATAARMEELSSAAAFVEGGVQDACDDACSICLEAFSDSDPSAVRLPAAPRPC
jgi:hypothetical protein